MQDPKRFPYPTFSSSQSSSGQVGRPLTLDPFNLKNFSMASFQLNAGALPFVANKTFAPIYPQSCGSFGLAACNNSASSFGQVASSSSATVASALAMGTQNSCCSSLEIGRFDSTAVFATVPGTTSTDDKRTRQIYETRFADGVPDHISVAAHETMHPLVASRSLQDVGVLGPIIRLLNTPERYGLHIDGKWHVTFAWSEHFGAYAIKLERR